VIREFELSQLGLLQELHAHSATSFGRNRVAGRCEGKLGAGLANCLFEGQRPKGPSCEEPFGTQVAIPYQARVRKKYRIDPRDLIPITAAALLALTARP
jgi:hypothetical protein